MHLNGCYRFQSTFPRGERHKTPADKKQESEFQSTFPRGERLDLYSIIIVVTQFQSTFPRGERRSELPEAQPRQDEFQSTFPRGERLRQNHHRASLQVSIHVPARGTTILSKAFSYLSRFQSTFPRGERRFASSISFQRV